MWEVGPVGAPSKQNLNAIRESKNRHDRFAVVV